MILLCLVTDNLHCILLWERNWSLFLDLVLVPVFLSLELRSGDETGDVLREGVGLRENERERLLERDLLRE